MGQAQRERQPVAVATTVTDAVSAGWGTLDELKDEMRERYDNAPDALKETAVNQAVNATAEALEALSEPDAPAAAEEIAVELTLPPPKRKPSRADRRDGAVAHLEAAVAAIDQWLEDNPEEDEEDEEARKEKEAKGEDAVASDGQDGRREAREALEALRDEVQEIVDAAAGLEFPGMVG
jgi:hypothetical protein